MKITLVKMMLAVLMLAGVWIGCKKGAMYGADDQRHSSMIKDGNVAGIGSLDMLQLAINPANDRNPFDHYGASHNERLTAVDAIMQEQGDDSRDAKREIFLAYVNQTRGKDIRESFARIEELMASYDQNPAILYKMAEVSTHKYLREISDLTAALNSAESYGHYIAAMKQLEDEVLADQDLSERGQQMLLIGSSIGRHSASWWYDQINRTPPEQTGKGFFHGLLRFHSYVNGDLFAGIASFLEGRSALDIIDDAVGMSEFFNWYIDCYWFPKSPRPGKF